MSAHIARMGVKDILRTELPYSLDMEMLRYEILKSTVNTRMTLEQHETIVSTTFSPMDQRVALIMLLSSFFDEKEADIFKIYAYRLTRNIVHLTLPSYPRILYEQDVVYVDTNDPKAFQNIRLALFKLNNGSHVEQTQKLLWDLYPLVTLLNEQTEIVPRYISLSWNNQFQYMSIRQQLQQLRLHTHVDGVVASFRNVLNMFLHIQHGSDVLWLEGLLPSIVLLFTCAISATDSYMPVSIKSYAQEKLQTCIANMDDIFPIITL